MGELDEDEQVAFKSKAKGFVRTYAFLSSILSYNNQDWEERSIFLNFLIPKLPSPVEEDLSKGVLETIDMDSYRAEKRAIQKIMLEDADSGPCRSVIPFHADHRFQGMPITDSGACRSPGSERVGALENLL